MENDKPISLRIPIELKDELDLVAKHLDRSVSWVVKQAIRQYVAAELKNVAAAE